MNNEILYRGLRKDGKGWAYGGIYRDESECFIIACESVVVEPDTNYRELQPVFYGVRQETVGQYTGLTDRKKEKVFGRMVVRHFTDFNEEFHGTYVDYEIIYRNGIWMCSYLRSEKGQVLPRGYTCGSVSEALMQDDRSKSFYFKDDPEACILMNCEIIHENPELLKGPAK